MVLKFVMTISNVLLNLSRGKEMARRSARGRRGKRTERPDQQLSRAAKRAPQTATHNSVSEFIPYTVVKQAVEGFADRRIFTLNQEDWEAFVAALDAPPRRHPRLARLFSEASVFIRKCGT